MTKIRHNWTIEELQAIYHLPLFKLIQRANNIHSLFHDPQEVQVCTIISVKTGGCPEDCKYCAQSSRNQTGIAAEKMLDYEEVMAIAKKAMAKGITRICLGAAWREKVRDNKQFEQLLRMVKDITNLGAEVCCTLGMIKEDLAQRLKAEGLYAYNHNLDTSEKFYNQVITTRTYQDRLDTLDVLEKTGISVCCGGILGLGETILDRLEMLLTLSQRHPHPESIPINRLAKVLGTPLENQAPVTVWEMVRMIATARIVLPNAMLRLSAGRVEMSYEQQALCFLSGANSIHTGEGDRMLTKLVQSPSFDRDEEMFELFGLKKRPAFRRNKKK